MEVRVLFIEGKRPVWLVNEATSGFGQCKMPVGTPKMQRKLARRSKIRYGAVAMQNLSKIVYAAGCQTSWAVSRRFSRPPPDRLCYWTSWAVCGLSMGGLCRPPRPRTRPHAPVFSDCAVFDQSWENRCCDLISYPNSVFQIELETRLIDGIKFTRKFKA